MRTTSTTKEWSVAGIVKSRSETTTTEPVEKAPPERDTPPPQSGNLTAGDYDDILNPREYADYAGRFLQTQKGNLPFVDTRTRIAIKVVDARGQPVPAARVEVPRKGGTLRLVTATDGTASLYPVVDGLSGQAKVKVSSPVGSGSRLVSFKSAANGPAVITLPGVARPVPALDLALVIDTTGSMGDEIEYLQAELDSIVTRLKRESGNLDLRIGVVLYRDEGDDYVVRSSPLTASIRGIRAELAEQEANGGGDPPEAVDKAMKAAEALQWRPEAAKAILLVADAPPHDEAIAPTLDSVQRLRSRGVQIVPVAASGVEDKAQYVMRTMAVLTQGRYIFLTDDSGIGDAHAEPNVTCYVVTRLDQLIGRVLAGIVQGRRIEAEPGEVIRTVGNYDRGRCGSTGPSNS